ncbi:protein IMPACT-A [Orussus abietinus]|uniref:protein IMPACT-A n=1 Tax=Orussus abietinus TaxID=222816 RepID=UPI000625F1DD|nr:protein IMPACT-A [Orussus abietinus]
MDNITQQADEIEALIAIYGNDWQIEDESNGMYSVQISEGNASVKLYLKLPRDYPSTSPPIYEISAPYLSHAEKVRLGNLLDDVYLSFVGRNVLFEWIEKIRSELQSYSTKFVNDKSKLQEDVQIPTAETINSKFSSDDVADLPQIFHGEVIIDRKSSFQGHAAVIKSKEEIKVVLNKLLENRKVQHATHNIYAYRIYQENTKSFIQDCEDDGESQAGTRLLHLLQIIDIRNVIVIVSRWYGGIHLGPDRFRHINNAARQVLTSAKLLPENKNKH